ncbi:hypothetical protein [Halomonas sp. BC04]|uniref:hypothetical protein n=1 Tax=Halomonas sp. BC04 TaxID=1403540 RepID=UPI0003ED89CE|nr:hypothetical protein [Halomonas sp. BC04]EWG98907.1 hypothetical protein Q427_27870 [Halomonas sp. BC04]
MERIRGASQRVNDLMGEISAASEEQSDGIGQISQAITQIDQGTQESSVAMHTYNRSTESLQREIHALSHSAQAFLSEAEITAIQATSAGRHNGDRDWSKNASKPKPLEQIEARGNKNRQSSLTSPTGENEWASF